MTTKCAHEDFVWHRAEPDVGISLPYAECNDCGETTSDYEIGYDYDTDEDGHVYGGEWQEPVWPDTDDEDEEE